MQIHQLKPKHSSQSRKIVGRGGKKGTYSGRGGKGQTARAGRKLAPIIRELIKRYPKLKGYRAFVLESNLAVVNLGVLNTHFKDQDVINPLNLLNKGIIRMIKGKQPQVKILGSGKLEKKLQFEHCQVSNKAKEIIIATDAQIIDVHNLRGRKSGHKYFFDFHVTLPDSMSFVEVHKVIEKIEDHLSEEFEGDVIVHADPQSVRSSHV